MRPEEQKKLTALVTDVMAYYGKNVSEFTLSVWLQACEPFEFDQVKKALSAHATDPERGMFAPKVADIVRILAGTPTDRSMLAWGKTHEAMSSVGAYTDVVFDDPAIHAVIADMGGWPKVCRYPLDELSYLQHRFCEAHKAYTRQGAFVYARQLMGDRSPDSEYIKVGLNPPKPAVIGRRSAARDVYRGGSVSGKTAISYQALEALEMSPAVPLVREAA